MRTGTLAEEDEDQELIENIRDVTVCRRELYLSCAANLEFDDNKLTATTEIRRFTMNDLGELEMGGPDGAIVAAYYSIQSMIPYRIRFDVEGAPPLRWSPRDIQDIRRGCKAEILFSPANENGSFTVSMEGDLLNDSLKMAFLRLLRFLDLGVSETTVTFEFLIPLLVYDRLQCPTLLQRIQRKSNTTIELLADPPAMKVVGKPYDIFNVQQCLLQISRLRLSLRISNEEQTRERIMALPLNEKISRFIEPSCIEGSVIITFEGPESHAIAMIDLIKNIRDIDYIHLRREFFAERFPEYAD